MWRLNPDIEPLMKQRDGISCLSWLKLKPSPYPSQTSLACWSQYWKHFEGMGATLTQWGYGQVDKSVRSSRAYFHGWHLCWLSCNHEFTRT
ncbi:hypothetical protein E2542_SST28484 [Spatholobus suberectus]|nr:hypothetical protein E2542_SST28484 [Spatholobus suberectus]